MAELEADIDPGPLLGIATTARQIAVLVVTNGHTPRVALEHFKIAGRDTERPREGHRLGDLVVPGSRRRHVSDPRRARGDVFINTDIIH